MKATVNFEWRDINEPTFTPEEIINDYQDIIPKDIEQALKNLADQIEGDVYGKRSQ